MFVVLIHHTGDKDLCKQFSTELQAAKFIRQWFADAVERRYCQIFPSTLKQILELPIVELIREIEEFGDGESRIIGPVVLS